MILGQLIRVAALTIACAMLSSCYLVPGTFTASLHIRSDGSFTYRYVGDIAYVYPDKRPMREWQDSMARCFDVETAVPRTCSPTEIDQQRTSSKDTQDRHSKQSAEIAALIGFNPLDADANRKIATEMMEYEGWKHVTYKGDGVFSVQYELSGTLDRDFLFPISPQAQAIIPFLSVRQSKAGVVNISAPGFTGGVMRKVALGNMGMPDKDLQYFDRINGTFELTTDAEISHYTGKSERSGKDKKQTKIHWQIVVGELDHLPRAAVEAQLILPLKDSLKSQERYGLPDEKSSRPHHPETIIRNNGDH